MIRIAFASKNGINVDEHFGWCQQFYIYEVTAEESRLVKEVDSSEEHTQEVDKLIYKIESLDNSDIVCVAQIGPKASNMVQKAGVYPMSTANAPRTIADVIDQIQKMMQGSAPLWLKRIMLTKDS